MIEYKDITQLETLDELADGSYIMVVQDGTAKLISKENAKFGGITTFYAVESTSTQSASGDSPIAVQVEAAPSYTLQHSDGTEVTAQEAYDAYMAGGVRLALAGNTTAFADVIAMSWVDSNGEQLDPANVGHVEFTYIFMSMTFGVVNIGEAPGK